MAFDLERWSVEYRLARSQWRELTEYPGRYEPRRADALRDQWVALAKTVLLEFAALDLNPRTASAQQTLGALRTAARLMCEGLLSKPQSPEKQADPPV